MQSTFSGIELGKRSLFAHSLALSTIGQNLSNASTEGYSRQRVELSATMPLYRPQLNSANSPGQIGQGVDVTRIERVRDELLEGRIIANANGEGYWGTRDSYIMQLEQLYNEPSELSVRHLMDQFWDSWQELSIYPEQMASRQAVLQTGESLVEGIQLRYQGLAQIQSMLEDDIQVTVGHVNDLSEQIAALNDEIVKVKAAGDEPNDLMDQRDKLVEELSQIIDVTVDYRDSDEINVHTAGMQLIQGGEFHTFELVQNPGNEGMSSVVWDFNGDDVQLRGGKLAALLELRDVDIREEIQGLDNMAVNFVDLVNEIHQEGYGLNGVTGEQFFTQYPVINNTLGNFDSNGDGNFDSSYIFRIRGTNNLDPQQEIGLAGTMTFNGPDGLVSVDYRPEDTVSDVIQRINHSGSEVVARLDRQGRMELKATPSASMDNPDFVIGQIEDSGQFLVGYSGILLASGEGNGFYSNQVDAVATLRGGELDYEVTPLQHPSAWIAVNETVANDPSSIAASLSVGGRPGEMGNGSAALAIASIRNQNVMVGQIGNFDDYFADTVASVGLKGQESQLALDTQEHIMKDLRDTRASISGVNIDEELAEMIKFQHGYNAASRFITEFDQMLDTIINRMGA